MSTPKIPARAVRRLKLDSSTSEVPSRPSMFTISRRVLPPHFCREGMDKLVNAVLQARALDLTSQVVLFSNWPHKQSGTSGRMFRSRCSGSGETIDVVYRRPGSFKYIPQAVWKAYSRTMNRWHCLVLKRRPDNWGRDRDGVHVFWVAESRAQITIIEGMPASYVGAGRVVRMNRAHYPKLCRTIDRHIYGQLHAEDFQNQKVLPGVPKRDPSWRTA